MLFIIKWIHISMQSLCKWTQNTEFFKTFFLRIIIRTANLHFLGSCDFCFPENYHYVNINKYFHECDVKLFCQFRLSWECISRFSLSKNQNLEWNNRRLQRWNDVKFRCSLKICELWGLLLLDITWKKNVSQKNLHQCHFFIFFFSR